MAKQRLVFVSHAGEDTWVAKRIAHVIETTGARTFLATIDIEAGAEFEEQLRMALNGADELVILITPSTLPKKYVWAELSVAWSRRILVVPLLLGMTSSDLQCRPDAPVWLKARHHLPLNAIETYLEQLRRRINQQRQGVLND